MAKSQKAPRYHLSKNNEARVCKAKKRPCPRAATGHFRTTTEAYESVERSQLSARISQPTTPARELLPRILAQPRRWHGVQSQLLLPLNTVSSIPSYWHAYQHAIKEASPADRPDLEARPNLDPDHPSIKAGLDAAAWILQTPTRWHGHAKTFTARNNYGELLVETTKALTEGRHPHNPFRKKQTILLADDTQVTITGVKQGWTEENDKKNTITCHPPTITFRDSEGKQHRVPVTPTLLAKNQQGVYLHRDLTAEDILDSPQEDPTRNHLAWRG